MDELTIPEGGVAEPSRTISCHSDQDEIGLDFAPIHGEENR
jgi:hypothetical protein